MSTSRESGGSFSETKNMFLLLDEVNFMVKDSYKFLSKGWNNDLNFKSENCSKFVANLWN
jgi:hypothetical protein